jgi:hypothetical protein
MAGLGQIYVELDLDWTPFQKSQERLKAEATSAAATIEGNFKRLGVTSDTVFQAMANKAVLAFDSIKTGGKASASEVERAYASMVAKINTINQDMTKNPLFEQMGIRSVAAINAQKAAVISSYETIKASGSASAQDLINIERAKNAKLKELNAEMVGSHEMSMASLTRAVLRFYAAWYVLSTAAQSLVTPFIKGFKAVEDYAQSVASLAAMVVTFSEAKPGQTLADQWQTALKYSTAIVPVLEQIAARTLLSGQETTALANAFARSGVFLQANNAAQIEGFTRISNALPLMTKGQEIMRQINTEIRSVMTGQNEQSSMMLQTLKALPGYSKENLELWRQQGTVLENIGKLLEGFGPATAMLEEQWMAVKTTLDTTVTQILRAGMLGTYGEIILSAKDLNKYLEENKDALIDGMSRWLGNFVLTLYTIKAEVLRLAMLLDKLGGTMTSAKMLLYGPGAALGFESSKKRFEASAEQNINYEQRYKQSDAELEKLAIRYNKLAESITDAGLAAAKLARGGGGGDYAFKAKPMEDKEKAGKENQIRLANLAEATAENREYYDNLIEQSNHWLRMSKIGGQSDLDGTVQVINDKKIALNEWYDMQSASLVKFQDKSKLGQAVLAKDEARLWKEYSKSWEKIKNEEAETSARIGQKAYDDSVKLMMDEINMGVKLTEESMRRPQKEADEARKMVTFYNDIRGMEAEYRNAKFEWIEKEAALKKSKGEEEVAVMRWVAQQREMLNREQLKGVEEKFNYDNQYTKDTITNMGKVLDAAMTMYDKDSSEYKRLSEWKRGLQAVEMAMEVAKNVALLSFMVAENAAYAAAMAKKAASIELTAAEAILTQGTGDPYTAFARIAAMAAIVAGILGMVGMALGGGGSSAGTSYKASTGYAATTVLGGEAGASSESVTDVTTLLADIHAEEYSELQAIYRELQELNTNITGLTGSILKTAGFALTGIGVDLTEQLSGGRQVWNNIGITGMANVAKQSGDFYKIIAPFEDTLNSFFGQAGEWLFGGSTNREISGGGVSLSPTTISALNSGKSVEGQQYITVKSTTSGGVFGKDKVSLSTTYAPLEEEATRLITQVYKNLGNTAVELAKIFGMDVGAALNYMFPAVTIDLFGLTGEEINKKLAAWISETGDVMAKNLFGDIVAKYQLVGEGMYETAIRVATGMVVVRESLAMIGLEMEGTTVQLIEWTQAMIDGAGGLDKFQEQVSLYYEKFFNDAERNATQLIMLNKALSEFGLSLPGTREEFRKIVESIDISTESGMKLFLMLMDLAGMASDYYSYSEEVTRNYTEMQIELMEMLGDSSEALAAKRRLELEAMDESLWALQEAIWSVSDAQGALSAAEEKLRESFDVERKLIEDVISGLQSAISKLISARESLKMEGFAAEIQRSISAQLAFNVVLSQARLGDFSGMESMGTSLSNLVSAANSTNMFATKQEYEENFYKTYNTLKELESLTGEQLTFEEKNLKALDDQLNALLGINNSILSLTAAIANYINAKEAFAQASANARAVASAPWTPPGSSYTEPGTPVAPAPPASAPPASTTPTTPTVSPEEYVAEYTKYIQHLEAYPEDVPVYPNSYMTISGWIDNYQRTGSLGYAQGGYHEGGWRMVGEQGPELEYTGASRIFSNKDSKALIDNSELVNEVKQLRQELYAATYQIAKNTGKSSKILDRFDLDGLPPTRT